LKEGKNYFDVHKALKSVLDEELEKEIDRVLMTNLVMAEEVELEDVGGRSEETMFSAGGRLWAAKSVVKMHPSWAKLIKFLTQGIYGHDRTETERRFEDKKKWKFL
jgi:hypothetical protein